MLEHRIQLRRGWECREIGAPESELRRVDLPTRWDFEVPRRLTLTRRFGRIALDPVRQDLILQMDEVAGTHAIFINGRSIVPVSATTLRYAIELTDLAERNVVVLEIETPPRGAKSAGTLDDWGMIALVVRTIEPPSESVLGQIAPGVVDEFPLE